jgi:hypothetical protein
VVAWDALAAQPGLAAGFDHLVALDPPPGGMTDPLLGAAPRAHLAWGPAEAEFAIQAYRAALDLRPPLTGLYRALRELPADASPPQLEAALRGGGRYPLEARRCARLIRVLTEVGLVELDLDRRACTVMTGVRADLDGSATFRAARDELARAEHALGAELPAAEPAAVAG